MSSLEDIHKRIAKAAKSCDRNPLDINLVAVSKVQPEERVQSVLEDGHRLFGENRVQEAQERWSHFKGRYSRIQLHLIGPLQTNKVKDAISLFDVIETVDREKLAKALSEEMHKQDRHLPCFIQVNTGDEDQKSGISLKEAPEFLSYCKEDCGLNITGLMCIPPIDEPAGMHFGLLRKLRDELGLEHLSMGMSADFETAIRFGATHIRVGSALFGQRDY